MYTSVFWQVINVPLHTYMGSLTSVLYNCSRKYILKFGICLSLLIIYVISWIKHMQVFILLSSLVLPLVVTRLHKDLQLLQWLLRQLSFHINCHHIYYTICHAFTVGQGSRVIKLSLKSRYCCVKGPCMFVCGLSCIFVMV